MVGTYQKGGIALAHLAAGKTGVVKLRQLHTCRGIGSSSGWHLDISLDLLEETRAPRGNSVN